MFWEIFGVNILVLVLLSGLIGLGNKLVLKGKLSQTLFGMIVISLFATSSALLTWYFTTKYFCG